MKEDSPPQTQRTHMADDVLRTRRLRREKTLCNLCALCVSAAVRYFSNPVYSIENRFRACLKSLEEAKFDSPAHRAG